MARTVTGQTIGSDLRVVKARRHAGMVVLSLAMDTEVDVPEAVQVEAVIAEGRFRQRLPEVGDTLEFVLGIEPPLIVPVEVDMTMEVGSDDG